MTYQLDVRLTEHVIDVLHHGKRLASHARSRLKGRHTTVAAHMPQAPRQYAEWTPKRLLRWAAGNGVTPARIVETILASRTHPQQGFRSCLGIMRLGKSYGTERLEAAWRRALKIGACSYKSLDSILKNTLDKPPLSEPPTPRASPPSHDNIRGPTYSDTPDEEKEDVETSHVSQTPSA